jgi:phosphoserine phosphatase RsbU/P
VVALTMSIRPTFARRLLLVLGGGSVLVYALVFVLQARMTRQVTLKLTEAFADSFVGARAGQVDREVLAVEDLANALAALPRRGGMESAELQQLLCTALTAQSGAPQAPAVPRLRIRGVRLSLQPTSEPGDRGRRDIDCALEPGTPRTSDPSHTEAQPVGWLATGPTRGIDALSFTLPLAGSDRDSPPAGKLRVDVAPEAVRGFVELLRPARGAALLLTADGRVLAWAPRPTGNDVGPSPGADSPAELEALGARVAAGGVDRGFLKQAFPSLPGASWIAYRQVKASGWWLVEAAPEDALLLELNALRLRVIGLLLVGGVLLLALAALLARGVTRPVTALAGAAERIASGDLETGVPVVRSRDEVGDLARCFEEMRVSLRHHVAEVARLAEARARIEADLRVAREIQLGLLPTDFASAARGHAAEIHALVVPARQVGGDLYDVFRLDEDRLCLVLGDVSGKGIPASLFMTAARTLLRAVAHESRKPAEILALVNDQLAAENPRGMYVTAFCGILDLKQGRLSYANAGHLPPALLPRSGRARLTPELPGLPLGLMPGAAYDPASLDLAPGDSIVLYTDGVTEALDEHGKFFEAERFLAGLSQGPRSDARGLVEHLLAAVRAFVVEAPQSDDIGLLALWWGGRDRPESERGTSS